jgi:hypothetical protein
MNKVAIILSLFVLTGTTWFMFSGSGDVSQKESSNSNSGKDGNSQMAAIDVNNNSNGINKKGVVDFGKEEDWNDIEEEEPAKPATELYQSAEEALDAVKKAATDYDDLVLEQFVQLGPNCSWCDSFYSSVKDLMISAAKDSDEKSYFAELLAVSGRPENVQTILDELNKSESKDGNADFDLYLDALEMTIGNDDVVKLLSENLGSQNGDVKESVIAAITNQGSPYAIDTLYQHTISSGVQDGYYDKGIGLAEVIPSKESFPLLLEMAGKKDDYSHLAVKSLLNSGVDGLQAVYDMLNNSNNPEKDKVLLQGASDHVPYDEETENFLRDVVSKSPNSQLSEFAKESLDILQEDEEEELE